MLLLCGCNTVIYDLWIILDINNTETERKSEKGISFSCGFLLGISCACRRSSSSCCCCCFRRCRHSTSNQSANWARLTFGMLLCAVRMRRIIIPKSKTITFIFAFQNVLFSIKSSKIQCNAFNANGFVSIISTPFLFIVRTQFHRRQPKTRRHQTF